MKKLLASLVLLVLAPAALTAQALTDAQQSAIDQVFADYADPDSPGAAVAVIRGGEVIYSEAFGSAQLEYGIPVEPTTIFHVASVSKQFTAMAVLLLVEEGRIDLDADLRTYLDWVPELPAVITPRQVLSHTSGVRDQWELLYTAGWRLDDVITKADVRRLMTKQQGLNFRPGTRYLYSNMGFSLAAELVEEVSGMPFDDFVKTRILDPLGMERTHVHDDHQHVVPGRAYSYVPGEGGNWNNGVLSFANHGATSLFTTAEDLVVWLDNYRTGTVGGGMLEEMTRNTQLSTGESIDYALGVVRDSYRGRTRIQHGGADAGFRSYVAWFPEDEVGIAVVSNRATTSSGGLANAVADVVLGSVLAPVPEDEAMGAAPQRPTESVPVSVELLERYEGSYSTSMVTIILEVRGDELWIAQPNVVRLLATSETSFVADDGAAARIDFEMDGDAVSMMRVAQGEMRLEGTPMAPEVVTTEEYVGTYYSPEVEALYEVREGDDGLILYNLRRGEIPLVHQRGDVFAGTQFFVQSVEFRRDSDGRVAGFRMTGSRVRNHAFLRVDLPLPGR